MTQQPRSLEQQIKDEAYKLGFSLVGIASPDRPPTFDAYREWIEAGRHASMAYLASERASERRQDPRRILPECESIIVTGTPYLPEDHHASTPRADLRVASYALGEDYHEVIYARLKALAGAIESIFGHGIPHKLYTDTGPILERDLAQRAGLGWIGKNTCLINPEQGSYFLLGEILLAQALNPDVPFEADHCGTCTRCIEACPTDCILPDRTIDAGRCISYLTIEEKGAIAVELREKVDDWLFGCDICQQVCPWNKRFAQPTADAAFQPRALLKRPELGEFLGLKAGNWLQGLHGSPLERPRRRGLVRNASVVAGNKGAAEQRTTLTELLLEDPEPLVRGHAAWALGQLPGQAALRALREALASEADPGVQTEIQAAISAHNQPA